VTERLPVVVGDSGGLEELQVGDTIPSTGASRRLIEFIDSGPAEGFAGAYRETTGGPFPTGVTWWTNAGKTDRIVELTITRDAGQRPTVEVWELYDADGSTVLLTATDTIAYSGGFEASRTRVIT
jgi:hypothetical protein